MLDSALVLFLMQHTNRSILQNLGSLFYQPMNDCIKFSWDFTRDHEAIKFSFGDGFQLPEVIKQYYKYKNVSTCCKKVSATDFYWCRVVKVRYTS